MINEKKIIEKILEKLKDWEANLEENPKRAVITAVRLTIQEVSKMKDEEIEKLQNEMRPETADDILE